MQDRQTKIELDNIKKKLNRLSSIPQVSSEATLSDLIKVVNKIISKEKRR